LGVLDKRENTEIRSGDNEIGLKGGGIEIENYNPYT
jgi:hypothetical protein|tara:strand:- start:769 stop:876 length:108 start_codon:yes stop_codon:yes gene_type:complete